MVRRHPVLPKLDTASTLARSQSGTFLHGVLKPLVWTAVILACAKRTGTAASVFTNDVNLTCRSRARGSARLLSLHTHSDFGILVLLEHFHAFGCAMIVTAFMLVCDNIAWG